VFVCDRSPAARGVLEDRLEDALVLDLAGARPPGSAAPVVHPDINPQDSVSHRGLLAVPHPVAAVLARILHPIERHHGIRRASALVARPASDFGERGLEELRDQTVSLLRFADPPRGVFGRQLAFNVIPEACLGPLAEPDLDARVSAETAAILAWGGSRLAVGLLAVPVFYGHVVAARVEVERPAKVADLVRGCREGGLDIVGEGRGACTPVDAAGERGIALCDLREDGLGGFWLWCVAGEAGAAAAELALRLAGLAATPEERRA
jgi:aspartate-semialdehyde dehydrogenase